MLGRKRCHHCQSHPLTAELQKPTLQPWKESLFWITLMHKRYRKQNCAKRFWNMGIGNAHYYTGATCWLLLFGMAPLLKRNRTWLRPRDTGPSQLGELGVAKQGPKPRQRTSQVFVLGDWRGIMLKMGFQNFSALADGPGRHDPACHLDSAIKWSKLLIIFIIL